MARTLTDDERDRYHGVRLGVRASTRSDGLTGTVTRADIAAALAAVGRPRSERYVSSVLDGERVSRPALRDIAAAIPAVRTARRAAEGVPAWF